MQNSDLSDFYVYKNTTLPSDTFRSIKFSPGDPYPFVLMMGYGIVKTAENFLDWKIIRFESNFSYETLCLTRDGKFIAVGGFNETIMIYKISEL